LGRILIWDGIVDAKKLDSASGEEIKMSRCPEILTEEKINGKLNKQGNKKMEIERQQRHV
jgi:hypothetical protein